MRRETFVNYCQAVTHGSERYVRNLTSKELGKVVWCEGDRFEVEVNDHREVWFCEDCEEEMVEPVPRPS